MKGIIGGMCEGYGMKCVICWGSIGLGVGVCGYRIAVLVLG